MSNRSPFNLPGQYHYDVFEVSPSGTLFMCSTNHENRALEIADGLRLRASGNVEYKVRSRPTKAHTLFTFRGQGRIQ